METCTTNCEAYMTLARLTINLGSFNYEVNNLINDQTPKSYLLALEDDLRELAEI